MDLGGVMSAALGPSDFPASAVQCVATGDVSARTVLKQ